MKPELKHVDGLANALFTLLPLRLRQLHRQIYIDAQTHDGFRPFFCISVCVIINAVLSFDGDVDANADVKCEQTSSRHICLADRSIKTEPYVTKKN